jgi:hypothetical protein
MPMPRGAKAPPQASKLAASTRLGDNLDSVHTDSPWQP